MNAAIGLTLIALLLAAIGVLCIAIRNWNPREETPDGDKPDAP